MLHSHASPRTAYTVLVQLKYRVRVLVGTLWGSVIAVQHIQAATCWTFSGHCCLTLFTNSAALVCANKEWANHWVDARHGHHMLQVHAPSWTPSVCAGCKAADMHALMLRGS